MIVVRIIMNALPDKQKEVVQTLLSMMSTMEKLKGCLNYSLLCDLQDKNLLCVLEEWEDREKLDHHLKSDMFGVLLGTRSLLRHPHGIHIYTVQHAEGMNAVRTARDKKKR
jgi:quinol monooxygenase YgiN